MKTKRIISVLTMLAMLFTMFSIPTVSNAFDVDTVPVSSNFSNNRADLGFRYMGTSDTLTPADLDSLSNKDIKDFVWKEGDYVWIAAIMKNASKALPLFSGTFMESDEFDPDTDKTGLINFTTGLLYNSDFFEAPAASTDFAKYSGDLYKNSSNELIYRTRGSLSSLSSETTYDVNFDDAENAGDNTPVILDWVDKENITNNTKFQIVKVKAEDINITDDLDHDQAFEWTSSTAVDDSKEYIMTVYALKMKGDGSAAAAVGANVVQGFMSSFAAVNIGNSAAGTAVGTPQFSIFPEDEEDMGAHFNIKDTQIKLFPSVVTITYNPTSGSFVGGDATKTETVVEGGVPTYKVDVSGTPTSISSSAVLTPPTDKSFLGWYEKDGSSDPDNDSAWGKKYDEATDTFNTDTTLYARYGTAIVTHTVTYKPGNTASGTFDGTETELTETVNDNDPATFNVTVSGTTYDISGGANYMTAPTNYVFDGWYDGTTKVTPGTYAVTGDVTLTAKYVRPDRTVTFHRDSKDSSITGQEIYTGTSTTVTTNATQTETVANGDPSANVSTYKVKPPAATSSAAYNFSGWSLDGTNPYTATTAVTGDIDLYPLFTPISQYKLTFDLKGGNISGSTTNPSSDIYNGSSYDDAVTAGFISSANDIRTITPTKTGFTFAGWQKSGGTDAFSDTTAYDADTTFEAQWTENTIDLTFKDSKTASPAADSTITIAEGSSIDASNSSNSTKYPATDVPASLTPAANYKWYGWYTLEGSTALTDVQGKTKAALDTLKTGNGIKEFTKTTTASADTTIYGLYYLSDDATLSGVVFKEEDNSGRDIDFVQDNNFNPVQLPKTLATGKTAADYTALGTPATFAPATTKYYMIVDNDVENVYAKFTTTEPGSTITVNKGSSTTDLGNPATIPVEVTKEKSYTTANVEVTAPDGSTKKYEFNILRLAVPKIELKYGNSPVGLIYRDDQQFDTLAKKQAAEAEFKNSDPKKKRNLTFGTGGQPVPIISGTMGDPDEVRAQTERPYSIAAWRDDTENYDLNKDAFFVTQSAQQIKFYEPGYTVTDEFGFETNTGLNVEADLKKQKAVIPDYSVAGTAKLTDYKLIPDGTGLFTLKKIMIRPGVYTMKYSSNATSIYGFTYDLKKDRPLIFTNKLGDIVMSSTPTINPTDYTKLMSTWNDVNAGYGFFAFRIADVVKSTTPTINPTDYTKLMSTWNTLNSSDFRFYPELWLVK